VETQKRFADNDFVAIAQCLTLSWGQSLAAVDECAVGRTEILEKILAVAQRYARVTARYFGFRIVGVEIDVREDTAVSIPPSDLRFHVAQHKLLATRSSALND
jgi:hypothetical protein